MSVKGKSAMSIKLDDRYKVIIEIAVKKMKADGIQSATKTDVVRQVLELYAKERQSTNDVIHNELNGTEQNADNSEKGTAKAILKHFGTWAGGKEDAEKVLKYIIENKTEAEF